MSDDRNASSDTSAASKSTSAGDVRKGSLIIPVLLLAVVTVLFLVRLKPQLSEEELKLLQSETDLPSWLLGQVKIALHDLPVFFAAQWNIVWKLLLLAVIPGFAGLIYRRSLWRWFVLAFVILYVINVLFGGKVEGLVGNYRRYLVMEGLLILMLVVFRLTWRQWRMVDVIFLGFNEAMSAILQWLKEWTSGVNPFGNKATAAEGVETSGPTKVMDWLFLPVKLAALLMGMVLGLVPALVAEVAWLAYLPYLVFKLLRPPNRPPKQRGLSQSQRDELGKKMRNDERTLSELRKFEALKQEKEEKKEPCQELNKLIEELWAKVDEGIRQKAKMAREFDPNLNRVLLEKLVIEQFAVTAGDERISTRLTASIKGAIDAEFQTGKNIVVCLDGTWNEPGMLDFGHHAETNVLKLFKLLESNHKDEQDGNPSHYNASLQKEYTIKNPTKKATEKSWVRQLRAFAERAVGKAAGMRMNQLAFYYRGVGNTAENNPLAQKFGGAFGLGAAGIVDRAYLDVARVWQPGDRVFIFGFSRGAATARLLAGAIGRRGVPKNIFTLHLFGRHFTVWQSTKKLDTRDRPIKVDVLGCWDTVGAFGISKNVLGIPFQKIDLLKDLSVSTCVKRAYHMVALDETRDAFVPTLMDMDPIAPKRIIEVWFAGNHANVGGGYATDGLSDVTLSFLLKHISSGYANRESDDRAIKDMIEREITSIPDSVYEENPDEPNRAYFLTPKARECVSKGVVKLIQEGRKKRESDKEDKEDKKELDEEDENKMEELNEKEKEELVLKECEDIGRDFGEWVLDKTKPGSRRWGLYLTAMEKDCFSSEKQAKRAANLSVEDRGSGDDQVKVKVVSPDPSGRIRHSTGPIYTHAPREVPLHAIIHKSVFERMEDSESRYAPQSLINLNRRFLEERYRIEIALKQMKDQTQTNGVKEQSEQEQKEANMDREKFSEDWKGLADLEAYLNAKQHWHPHGRTVQRRHEMGEVFENETVVR